jgi:cation/acetate symporter
VSRLGASLLSPAGLFFIGFVSLTLLITAAAARKNRSARDFYTAGGQLPGWMNGIALAGDYLSAAAFLGSAGMYLGLGYDSLVYAVGTLAGWPLLLLLMAEKLRRLGRYTVADVLAQRFPERRIRLMTTLSSLTVTLFYLIVQMVGAGKLIELLFGLPYLEAVALVGLLMVCYVSLGGMLATTWVQMTKALLMMATGLVLAVGVLHRYAGNPARLFDAAAQAAPAQNIFLPSHALSNPLDVLSLGLGLTLGLLGLPHVLMRFLTVPDARAARHSVGWATGLVTVFFTLNIVVGYGALALVSPNAQFHDAAGKLLGGSNMAAIHLADLLGGATLQGLVAAVAFATILAVVAGLTMAGASAISHDLYANWQLERGRPADERRELSVSRWATLGLGLAAVLLSTWFQNQNVSFLLGLAFALSASSQFPVLILALHWPGLSARGAWWGGISGILASLLLIGAGPAVWVEVLGFSKPLFPYANPALFSVPLAFLGAWLGSRNTAPQVAK